MDTTSNRNAEPDSVVDTYWTPERKARARRRSFDDVLPSPASPAPAPSGAPETVPGHGPLGERQAAAAAQTGRVPDPTAYPWNTVGQLFFVSAGEDWAGTACVIKQSSLLTVAHNLYDTASRSWSTHIRFEPAYTDGAMPFGFWNYKEAFVPTAWVDGGGTPVDIGVVKMKPGGFADLDVGTVVGWLGYEINRTYERTWIEAGYPGNFEDGRYMYADEGHYTRMRYNDTVIGKQSRFEAGASGSPWLMYGSLDLVNGVHSSGNPSYPGEGFSTYFTDWTKDFIQRNA